MDSSDSKTQWILIIGFNQDLLKKGLYLYTIFWVTLKCESSHKHSAYGNSRFCTTKINVMWFDGLPALAGKLKSISFKFFRNISKQNPWYGYKKVMILIFNLKSTTSSQSPTYEAAKFTILNIVSKIDLAFYIFKNLG